MTTGEANIGPIATPDLNNLLYVGSILYPTIQSAVTAASAFTAGAQVVIPYGATPSDTIAAASGSSLIQIIDQRGVWPVTYIWIGSSYVVDLGPVTHSEVTISALATPVNGTFTTSTTGGSLAASTAYYYRVAAIDSYGTTLASTQTSITTGSGSTNTVTVTWGQVSGATGYKVYGRTTGAELLIGTITSGSTLSFVDTGSVTPSGALPTGNTTGSLTVASSITATGSTPNTAQITLNSGTGFYQFAAGNTAVGWTNPLVQAGDVVFNFSGGTINTGYLAVVPYASAACGLRMDSAGNITETGHVIAGVSTAPTVAAVSSGAGTGATASLASGSSDLCGAIILTTGTGGAGGNAMVTLTFAKSYAATPKVFLAASTASSPGSALATAALSGSTAVWVGPTTTNFSIESGATAPAASTTYGWNYWVVG